MTTYREFTSFINDELVRVGKFVYGKTAAVFCWC